eukprot:5931049-Pyramimonas_sp.AAC.1
MKQYQITSSPPATPLTFPLEVSSERSRRSLTVNYQSYMSKILSVLEYAVGIRLLLVLILILSLIHISEPTRPEPI